MKGSMKIMFVTFSLVFMFSNSSWATSDSALKNFLDCLLQQSRANQSINHVVYTRDNSFYSSVLDAYVRNLRFKTSTTPKPLVIVTPTQEFHVPATVICAKENGLQIRIRSGGHDYEGLSYVSDVPFVLLDMFNLRYVGDIDTSSKTATVYSGATIGELHHTISAKSNLYGFPAGVCLTLGAGGHFSGGGYGNLMRKYGLASDNILDATITIANGTVLTRKTMGEDLFWAIRGGGAASFGVVHSWQIKLVPVPEKVTVFRIDKLVSDGGSGTDLVYKWQLVAHKLDNDLFIRLLLKVVNQEVQASFVALFLGQTDRLLKLMNASFPELGLQRKDCTEMSWVESTLFWANYPTGTSLSVLLDRIPKSESFLKRKSDYVKQPISKTHLESIWKEMIKMPGTGMTWNPYGGRMSEISESETPFPHRAGNIFMIQYASNWKEAKDSNHYINSTTRLFDIMTPYVSKSPREAFFPYRDLDIGTNLNTRSQYGTKYFKSNMERLVRVKAAVDPDNFFTNEQSIPTRR